MQSSAIKIAMTGWRDALNAIAQMVPVVGPAFLLTLVSEALGQLLLGYSFAADLAVSEGLYISQSLMLAPLAIAVHRYVLLGEVTPRYALNPTDQRVRRYFILAVAIQVLWLSIAIWFVLGHFIFGAPLVPGQPISPGNEGPAFWALVGGFIAVLVTGFIVGTAILGIVILFPALAVDAPGAEWRNARDDSRGHTYQIFCAVALGLLPTLPFAGVDGVILAPKGAGSSPGLPSASQAIGVILQAAEVVLIVAVLASITSKLYLDYGSRLNRAPRTA
ncbi:hypothetical protein [Bradyrhizobium sp. RD5-C2]|uniref:hypothetical protein n=1 Tax=Bradyrhizobium sp. RD5-C2 TaxID=244562 RepID=UPI001CC3B3D0|nr:hypothetical protein [Bradyrhizobium sp. RD5-C2]